jgi:hypothetical protein
LEDFASSHFIVTSVQIQIDALKKRILFTFDIFPVTFIVQGLALLIRITVQTTTNRGLFW